MNTKFLDVFDNLIIDANTKSLLTDVFIDRIVANKEKTLVKIYALSNRPAAPDILFSLEKQIKAQVFPGENLEVMILGIPAPEVSEAGSEPPVSEAGWDFDEAGAYVGADIAGNAGSATESSGSANGALSNASIAGSAQNSKAAGKSGAKAKDEKPKKGKKDYGENVLYGRPIKAEQSVSAICDLNPDNQEVVITGEVFKTDLKPLKSEKVLVFLYITDDTDSIVAKLFMEPEDADELLGKIKGCSFIKVKGIASLDRFDNEQVLTSIRGIEKSSDFRYVRMDDAPEKRVELHTHTLMSDMDGTISVKSLIKRAKLWGHKSIAITDHGNVQVFPDAAKAAGDDFKVIYGMEAYLCDDTKPLAHIRAGRGDYPLDGEMVVFDLETTGLNASKEEIIEIGAVKVRGSAVIDTFSAFVNPGKPLPYDIINLTGIDDSMLKDAPNIREVLPKFREFCGELPLVAHNADFDVSCIRANCMRLNIPWDITYLDTVPTARIMLPDNYKMKLDNVAKALMIPLDNHHRAVDDAMCTALIYNKFVKMLSERGVETIGSLNEMEKDKVYVRKLFPAHATILAKNDTGRINLYRLVSKSHLDYFHTVPRVPKSLLASHREGLIIGSGCARGELFDALLSGKHEEELERIISFYDFLEIMPAENYTLMAKASKYGISSLSDIKAINAKIVELGQKYGKPVIATGDAHYIDPEDWIYRHIILTEKKISPQSDTEPNLYLRTTDEMLEAFSFLGPEKAREVVITNTNHISDMCDEIKPTRPDKCPPVIENSDVMLREICYRKAHEMYGENLPPILEERLERELNSIISNGYALMYIIAQKLVWKSNEDGYIVGSRGSVGSSLVATMAGISEVNPLPPHYICKSCHYVDFDSEDVKSHAGMAGCDMPDKVCPECGAPLYKDGFDIPFETFLGFKGNKEPDIDLNFSSVYLNKAHRYTEVIFGEGQTYRAGTVGTIQENTAYAFAKSYFNKHEMHKKRCEIERISSGCLGVRRSTGQHPGGIIVLPVGEEMESFTPVQHPANDMKTDIVTTHFDFHSIDSNLLKLDILGKDDPTQIKLLEELTGVGVDDIPLDDRRVMSLFQNTDAIGLSPDDIMGTDFGTLGIPEFGTDFAMGILRDTKPQGIMDLVRIAGLSHGTDVWNGNAKELIAEGKATISTAICTRDDIMLYLIDMGMPSEQSFKIMESVRKGKGLTPEWKEDMIKAGIPDWYIWSCETIKYMFPKAHAAAYVMMAYRLGYFKVHYPAAFYAAYFSIKSRKGPSFDYEIMCQGPEVLMHHIEEYQKEPVASKKDLYRDMRIVQEMYMRGIEFLPIDLYESDAEFFKVIDGKLLPPFWTIDGMGGKAAETLALAASQAKFTSKDDIRDRGKVNNSTLEYMDKLGLLKGFSQSNQLSLFDLVG